MLAHASPYCDKMLACNAMSATGRRFINEFRYTKDDLGVRQR